MYVKGQKILYTEAKTICELRLSYLMLPSIFFTVISSIISLIVEDQYGKIISSSLNGCIAFILALINYLKLDAASEAHKISAHQYDKLQTSIEFLSGTTLLFTKTEKEIEQAVMTKITDTEKKIAEIKEANQFIVPKDIRMRYPIMYNTNVFLVIKKIEDIRKRKINMLKQIKNEKSYLIALVKSNKNKTQTDVLKNKIKKLEGEIYNLVYDKEKQYNDLLKIKSAFSIIDEMFMKELENAEKIKHIWFKNVFCCCIESLKNNIIDNPKSLNNFVIDIMDPFGKEDVNLNEFKTFEKNLQEKAKNDYLAFEKKITEEVSTEIKKTKQLLKDNVKLTEKLYDKVYDCLERGEKNEKSMELTEQNINSITSFPNILASKVVHLFGNDKKSKLENMKMEIAELPHSDSDPDDEHFDRKSFKSELANYKMDVSISPYSEKYN